MTGRVSFRRPGSFKTAEAFRNELASIDPELNCLDPHGGGSGPLGQPIAVLGRRLSNRFCVQPMEGWDATGDGQPSNLTLRRWGRFGQSGAKLIWGGEAFAVQRDGRANPNQLFLNPDKDPRVALASLISALRAGHRAAGDDPDEMLVGLQLTHSGRFSKPEPDQPRPLVVDKNPLLEQKYAAWADRTTLLSDDRLREIGDSFVRAASAAEQVGFDFVDVKCCHGYLLHECLSSRSRTGSYGGSFENRTRLIREIIQSINQQCSRLAVGVRVSITDLPPFEREENSSAGRMMSTDSHPPCCFGVNRQPPFEADWTEPFDFLKMISDLGVQLVNITIGSPYYCAHVQRPATFPPSDGYFPPEHPLASVARHIHAVRTCKRQFPELTMVGSGYSWLQQFLPHVAAYEIEAGHVDFVGLGRMVLAYPDLPRDVLNDKRLDAKRVCRTFSDCTTGPRNNMISGCFPLDAFYKARPEASEIRKLRPEV